MSETPCICGTVFEINGPCQAKVHKSNSLPDGTLQELARQQNVPQNLLCSGCGLSIAPNTKFLCIYKTRGGFELEVGCAHYMPEPGWQHIFGGSVCFHDWLARFEASLKTCNHEGVAQ